MIHGGEVIATEGRSRVRRIRYVCFAIGVVLTGQINHALWSMPSIVRGGWLESEYLAMLVASLVLGLLTFSGTSSSRENAIRGLLLTGPPYAWYGMAVAQSWLGGASDSGAHAKALGVALALAASGPVVGLGLCWLARLTRWARGSRAMDV